ncbi:hypothetical protein FACS189454_08860 [Planctomycetales bacterium]|nr:hypothetical protein FACS189454_08860 [Planctomycetales bacterium]
MPDISPSVSSDFKTNSDSPAELREQISEFVHWGGVDRWVWDVVTGSFQISEEFLVRYGYDPAELLPISLEKWQTLIHSEDVSRVVEDFLRCLTGGQETVDLNYRVVLKNGKTIWTYCQGGITRRDANGEPLQITGIIQDIDKYVRSEELMSRQNLLLSESNHAAQLLINASADTYQETVHAVLGILCAALKTERSYLWRNRKDEKGRFLPAVNFEFSWEKDKDCVEERYARLLFNVTLSLFEEDLEDGKDVQILTNELPDSIRMKFADYGVKSILITPIFFNDTIWGFVGFDDCRTEREWTATEIGILRSVGMLVASAARRLDIQAALETEKKLLQQVFDAGPVAVALTTGSVVKRANKHFRDLFQKDIGDDIGEIYVDYTDRTRILQQVSKHSSVENHQVALKLADGTIHKTLLTMLTIDYENRPSTLGWCVDINDLLTALQRAEAATKLKSEFLARVSHEIRTPMNAILGITHLLLQTEMSEQQRDHQLIIQTAANGLLGIIDDILDFSEIETGKMILEFVPFRMSEVLNQVVSMIEIQARNKGLVIEKNIGEDIHGDLIGDPKRVKQILVNLATNAVKFTEKGTVKLSITSVPRGTDAVNQTLLFNVTDTGIGINAEQVPRLFESFTQADGSMTRKYGGAGLGLAISKHLVGMLGGRISVRSELGRGTEFTFRLVFPKAEQQQDAESSEAAMASSVLNSVKVLLVEDNKVNQLVARELLMKWGIAVTVANNGQEGVNAVRNGKFDLVLMDIQMPVMDGLTATREIRKLPDCGVNQLPVLAMTAHAAKEDYQSSIAAGMNEHLTKPINPTVLKAALKKWLRKTKR